MAASILRNHSPARLKSVLAVLFAALALPTAAVIWQAYDQLKWEAWFQYRNQAESLTRSIDTAISNRISVAESRTFADFEFVSGTATANVVQRSPLSAFPVPQDVPGVIGFFQIDPAGRFSSPLTPNDPTQAGGFGISNDEFAQRTATQETLRLILQENALVREPLFREAPSESGGRTQEEAPPAPADAFRAASRSIAEIAETPAANEPAISAEFYEAEDNVGGVASGVASPSPQKLYEQDRFDQLNQPARAVAVGPAMPAATTVGFEDEEESRQASLGKLEDLQLDEGLQKRSESLDRDLNEVTDERKNQSSAPAERTRRVEQTATYGLLDSVAGVAGEKEAITTFQSEIDPLQFNLLDSGHMVFYRNAWRDNERYIQGLIVEQTSFSREVVQSAFQTSSLASMSNLIVGYRDDVIDVFPGGSYAVAASRPADLAGELLYRARLSAPLDSIELVFAINGMPPGPGASVLAWTTIIIGVVFVGGFISLYRLGLGQIQLARQQQDFVSAVSHELKTPLTSIRMYGEMLKEGWADADKQKQYYEYIHDESERLTRLISNVLQLARITRNEPQFDMQSVLAASLMDQVQSKISNHVERAGFDLEITINELAKSTKVTVDEDCFAQVAINLVDNAIKFSRDAADKRIEIGCAVNSNDEVEFTVRDYGPGIDKGQLRKIFKLFYRSESELTRESVGTGIGLAIVHQLVHAMNGSVDVRNASPGAEFRVTFPSAADT